MSAATTKPPYQEIFDSLLVSVMRAQSEVVAAWDKNLSPAAFDHELLNRHFAWLALEYREGVNRHLFEGAEGLQPLRTKGLRGRDAIPPRLALLLRDRLPLPHSSETSLRPEERAFMRQKKNDAVALANPTRISRLVATSLVRGVRPRETGANEGEEARRPYLLLRSPLAVVLDFLTAPKMVGSRAYALLTIRNFLFETFGIFPDNIGDLERDDTFTVAQLETALSHIWTSFRQRHNSKGWDPIPAEGRGPSGGLLRHFLSARGVLWMRFKTAEQCEAYLDQGQIRPDDPKFEFARSDHLEKLPELGELINELWGLPVPIRGADTIFRGGLKFTSRGGLILGLHGGAGAGKTSLALALGAYLAPLGIRTLFLTGEECAEDLESKAQMLIPDDLRRLSFFPSARRAWLNIQFLDQGETVGSESLLEKLERELEKLARALDTASESNRDGIGSPKPCRAVIVLDQIHDLLLAAPDQSWPDSNSAVINRLRKFILTCRDLRALVILTAGEDWSGSRAFDYLVDIAIGLSHEAVEEYGRKPDRQLILKKARHQLCSIGTHGFQIAGSKGVRFSPQINYQLDRRAIWRTRLPEMGLSKKVLSHAWALKDYEALVRSETSGRIPTEIEFLPSPNGVRLFRGANIFLNGEGSGAKAALALKIAMSPTFDDQSIEIDHPEKILVVSFLYPEEYYVRLREVLWKLSKIEYGDSPLSSRPHVEVIHLYPGNYRPDQLFNRVEWELDSAELLGEPYTSIIVDGLHNVFLQFPEIENYRLFWPQFYSSLRTRPLTVVSTHTTFVLQGAREGEDYRLDDLRTEPLRHALVQKTDFRFEVDPAPVDPGKVGIRRSEQRSASNIFTVKAVAAINQPIPPDDMLWSRDHLVLFESAQGILPFGSTSDRPRGSGARLT